MIQTYNYYLISNLITITITIIGNTIVVVSWIRVDLREDLLKSSSLKPLLSPSYMDYLDQVVKSLVKVNSN